jgi:hypothetical protein
MHKLALLVATAAAGICASTASAHNSAHFFVGDRCIQLGSQREAPTVGAGNPNQNAGQLDLIAGPGDQYGARFAADRSEQLLPGDCPA